MIIGSNIIYREKVSSTNDSASEMLRKKKLPEGTIIYAGLQTNGRGQRGNTWISEAGKNLTISIILYPDFLGSDQQFLISKLISLSISDLLKAYTSSISIKWPNDIYYKDDKIAGILIEYSLEGNMIQHCIAGVGININQLSFPPEIPNPVSLGKITRQEHDIDTVLSDFCRICDSWYKKLKEGRTDYIDDKYLKNIYMFNTPSVFRTNTGYFTGRITGIDSFGRLLVEHEDGNKEAYGFREIEFKD